MKFQEEFLKTLIERGGYLDAPKPIQRLEKELDNHLDSPWEGGCTDCFYEQPCLKASRLARSILERSYRCK